MHSNATGELVQGFFSPWTFLLIPGFVYEEPRDGSRSAVEILVGAPDGEINLPVVEMELQIASAMSQIPSTYCSLMTWLAMQNGNLGEKSPHRVLLS